MSLTDCVFKYISSWNYPVAVIIESSSKKKTITNTNKKKRIKHKLKKKI